MSAIGFLQYIRLKFLVTILRLLSNWKRKPFLEPPPNVERRLLRIPSRQEGRAINAWLYSSKQDSDVPSSTKPLPILINWHGSGFIVPSHGMDYVFCTQMAQNNNILVLDVDYRKAPENPYPAAIQDVEDVLAWVADQPDSIDTSRVAVSGFSAGATLALVAASSLRPNYPELDIKTVITFYPCTDLAGDARNKIVPRPIRPFPPWVLNVFYDSYAPHVPSRTDPRVSPVFADPSLFPPRAVIITCSGDSLKPEADALVARLSDKTRQVTALCIENVRHGFDTRCLAGSYEWEQREMAYKKVSEELREAFMRTD